MLSAALTATGEDPQRWAAIEAEAALLVADAERAISQPGDLDVVHTEAERLHRALIARRGEETRAGEPTTDPP